MTCRSNKCVSDHLPRTKSVIDPCICQKTDFNSALRRAALKSSELQHLCQLSMDFSYVPDCFHWWDQLFQLRFSLTERSLSVRGTSGRPMLEADLLPTSALRWVSCKSQASFYQVRWTETYRLPWGQSKCAVGLVTLDDLGRMAEPCRPAGPSVLSWSTASTLPLVLTAPSVA